MTAVVFSELGGDAVKAEHVSARLAGHPFDDNKGPVKKKSRHTAALRTFDTNVYNELKKRNLPTHASSCMRLFGESERGVLIHRLVRARELERLERTDPWL